MAKLVDDRARSSRIVGAQITEHSAPIGASMRTALQPFLREGETMPDIGFLLILVGRLLLARAGKLIAANSALELEGTDDAEPRARRDGKDRTLRSRVSLVRNQIIGIFGDLGLKAFAVWSPLPTGPDALLDYADTLVSALRDGEVRPEPLVSSETATFNAAATVRELTPMVEELRLALLDVAREQSELSTTQIAKNEAMTAHDSDFIRFVSLVEQLARAVGLVQVADRIRPSGRDPGVLADPGDPADDPAVVGPGASTDPATPPIEPGMPGSSPFRD